MSWGSYNQGHNGPGGPYENTHEPSGYVSHDPYAPDQPGHRSGYGQPTYGPPGQHGYGAPVPYARPFGYSYDAAHPPRPPVGFVQAGKLFFKNYANFYGRASRAEYWWMALWGLIAYLAVVIPVGAIFATVPGAGSSSAVSGMMMLLMSVMGIAYLGVIIPSLAVQVRRLHDAGFSGFFALFGLIPYVGWLAPFVMCLMPSNPDGVKFDNPDGSQPAST